jgi:hypothetical protein
VAKAALGKTLRSQRSRLTCDQLTKKGDGAEAEARPAPVVSRRIP